MIVLRRDPAASRALKPAISAIALAGLLAACGGGADSPGLASTESPASTTGAGLADEGRAQAQGLSGSGTPAAIAGRPDLVVMLKLEGDVWTLAKRHQLAVVNQFGQRPIWRLRSLSRKQDLGQLLVRLKGETTVRFAELNLVQEAPVARHNSVWAIGNPNGQHNSVWAIGRPEDYATQWAPETLRLAQAHALSLGTGVRVAVLDTGMDSSHPALASRVQRDPAGNVVGRDFVSGDKDPREEGRAWYGAFGHGTHVAGLVALVAPGARLMPVRVLDEGGRGNAWVLAEALAWAVDPDGNPDTDDGAHVVNMSLGGTEPTDLLRTAVALASCEFDDDDDDDHPGFAKDLQRCAKGHGAVVAIAAGNSGSADERQYPAAEGVKGSLAVAATTRDATLALFSNSGGWIGIAAPGEFLTSTVPGGGYGVWSGTSMAAPLVAGGFALVLATPSPNPQPGRTGLRAWTAEDVVQRITDRSAKVCGASLRSFDAAAAVSDLSALDPPGC
jgi:hypothetical protein